MPSPASRLQVVDDVAAVLTAISPKFRTGQADASGKRATAVLASAARPRPRMHEEGIDVIDADPGPRSASAAQRGGFKDLVGGVGLGEVGLMPSIDVTRLARN
jgi:hypothetical protein